MTQMPEQIGIFRNRYTGCPKTYFFTCYFLQNVELQILE